SGRIPSAPRASRARSCRRSAGSTTAACACATAKSSRWRWSPPRCGRRRRAPTASSSSPPTAKATRRAARSRCISTTPPEAMADKTPRKHSAPLADGRQTQFLSVITRDEATERFRRHLTLAPLGHETVALGAALGRVLGDDVVAAVDVPGFDRSNVDGFAVQAADTFGAGEEDRRRLALNVEVLSPGIVAREAVSARRATVIATGAMLPRGADAVVMVEHTEVVAEHDGTRVVEVARAVTAGENVSYAGTDIARGETVLRAGQVLTSREIGVLAAVGVAEVRVCRRPRVAILSTGDEIVAPGSPLPLGAIYDSNAAIIGAAVEELGGEPLHLGVVRDDEDALNAALTT